MPVVFLSVHVFDCNEGLLLCVHMYVFVCCELTVFRWSKYCPVLPCTYAFVCMYTYVNVSCWIVSVPDTTTVSVATRCLWGFLHYVHTHALKSVHLQGGSQESQWDFQYSNSNHKHVSTLHLLFT